MDSMENFSEGNKVTKSRIVEDLYDLIEQGSDSDLFNLYVEVFKISDITFDDIDWEN